MYRVYYYTHYTLHTAASEYFIRYFCDSVGTYYIHNMYECNTTMSMYASMQIQPYFLF